MEENIATAHQHVYSKYLASVAIAVLRAKPQNVGAYEFAQMIQKQLSSQPCSENVTLVDLVMSVRSADKKNDESQSIFSLMQATKLSNEILDSEIADSGYMSLSHSENLLKSDVNEAGALMLRYLTDTDLTSSNRLIHSHAGCTFGNLIDKLSDAGVYPSFLEDASAVRRRLVAELRDNGCAAMKKLEIMSESKTFLKATIIDLTTELERMLNLKKSNNSLENMNVMQLFFNILYALEHLLPKFKESVRDVGVDEAPPTNNEGFKEKIMSIWKERWHTDIEKTLLVFPRMQNNADAVLSKCRVVLNNILIECMESHSLISFSALQCLNTLPIEE